jgi:hypothetical protein
MVGAARSWRRAAGWALYLAFLAVLVEGSLQAFYYLTAGDLLARRVGRPIYRPDPDSGVWNRANLAFPHRTNEFRTMVYTNRQGFRTSAAREEHAVPKPPGSFRVLLLGPSFAFGWGVEHEEAIGEQLRRRLAAEGYGAGRTVEVVNAGVPGLDPFSQLRWFRARGRALEPDLVVQIVYGSMEVLPADLHADEDGYLAPPNASRTRVIGLAKQSATAFYGWILATRLRALVGGEPSGEVQGAGRKLTQKSSFDPSSPALAPSLAFYADLRRAVAEAGAQLLVVYAPLSYVVHPEDAARWRHLGVRDADGQRAFDAAYCAHLDARDVPCEDITDELLRAARGERLYYWLDIHWTPAGNRVAAEAAAERLLRSR